MTNCPHIITCEKGLNHSAISALCDFCSKCDYAIGENLA
jgi:hypothetical protein